MITLVGAFLAAGIGGGAPPQRPAALALEGVARHAWPPRTAPTTADLVAFPRIHATSEILQRDECRERGIKREREREIQWSCPVILSSTFVLLGLKWWNDRQRFRGAEEGQARQAPAFPR